MRRPSTTRVLSEDELLAAYLEGARKDVGELDAMAAQLRAAPGAWADLGPALHHLAHNVKGQGTAFGYPLMTRIGDSLMRLIKSTGDSAAPDLQVLGAHVSALQTVLRHDIRGAGGASGEALASRLEALVTRALG